LPVSVKKALAGRPIRRDGLELDLDMQLLVRLGNSWRQPALLREGTPDDARRLVSRAIWLMETRAPIGDVRVEPAEVSGEDGDLPARLYVPTEHHGPSDGGLIVYYHGGGWVTGNLDTHDQPCRLLASSSGVQVLSVDYRLAPEHPYPAPTSDAVGAFREVCARANSFGADPKRIAVAGDSAGGHLAAVTALVCAVDGGPAPAFQLLIYPVTDLANTAGSRVTFESGFVLSTADMQWFEEQFAGADVDRNDPRVSPLLAEDLSGVAPAMVVTAGFDPLRDEGEAYAARLSEAGVPTLQRRYPGYVHGFANALAFGSGPSRALGEMGGVLRAALATAPW
jgi:acetyl esterase